MVWKIDLASGVQISVEGAYVDFTCPWEIKTHESISVIFCLRAEIIWSISFTFPHVKVGTSEKLDNANNNQTCIIIIIKLVTVVKGDPKTPFSIATTLEC